MSEFNFKSAVCTSRSQSERLLALGLKKETADMMYEGMAEGELPRIMPYKTEMDYFNLWDSITPAWSLHRLMDIIPKSIYHKNLVCFLFIDQSVYVEYRFSVYGARQTIVEQFMKSNLWENLINCIEWLIKEGYFPKEYLV